MRHTAQNHTELGHAEVQLFKGGRLANCAIKHRLSAASFITGKHPEDAYLRQDCLCMFSAVITAAGSFMAHTDFVKLY